jgi:hypothetical protein
VRAAADLALDVCQRGERALSIDLHLFVTIRVGGYPDITFRGSGKPTEATSSTGTTISRREHIEEPGARRDIFGCLGLQPLASFRS